MSLWDTLTSEQALGAQQTVVTGGGSRACRRDELVSAGLSAGARLRELGAERGHVVACVLTNAMPALKTLLGAWLTGLRVASLPVISRGMAVPHYAEQLGRLARAGGSSMLLAEQRVIDLLEDSWRHPLQMVSFESLATSGASAAPDPLGSDDVVFIQYSSGTTAEPRGVALTTQAIERQMDALGCVLRVDPAADRLASWVPLSHDMGLFSWLLSWVWGAASLVSSPERFLASPASWLDDCSTFGATITYCPPFGLDLAVRASRLSGSSAPLSVRCCVLGAERVSWASIERATERFGARGLTLDRITPAYGLAEATLAVTLGELDEAPATCPVDGAALANGELRPVGQRNSGTAVLVSAGRPIPGTEVSTRAHGAATGLGEICVRSPSLAVGYLGDDAATAGRFVDGTLHTGDLGFLQGVELYVAGRLDDVIQVGARSVHALQIEEHLSSEPGVRKGTCALVDLPGSDGRSRLVLVLEATAQEADLGRLAGRLRRMALRHSGVPLDDFLFLPRRAFPKTPTGKPQRFRCRTLATSEPPDAVRVRLRRPSGEAASSGARSTP